MRISSSRSSKQMSPGTKFIFLWIFSLIFVVVGASAAVFGICELIRAKVSVDWPTTQGKVVASSVEYHVSDEEGVTYHAEVMYDFSVNNTTFSGNRIAYGDYGSSNPSHARRIVDRYPKGKSVTVHYMPGNPEECLLEPGIKRQSFFLPGFGLIFFTVGSLMAILLPKAMKKQGITEQGAEGDAVNRAP